MQFFSGRKKENNQEKIEQIIMEKYDQYYRLAYSYVHQEADACDIVQNGAYKALKSSHTLKQSEYAETWVYRIMLNETFRYLKQPRFASYEGMYEELDEAGAERNADAANIDLQNALERLQAEEKAIIIMKYFEEKKLEEIAVILDENVSTVKSKMYRAMKKMRITLSEQ